MRPKPWLTTLLAGLMALALTGCQGTSTYRLKPTAVAAASHSTMVYVVRRAWHIDIGFATPDLQPPLRTLLQAFPPASYLEFGFGDRHYLMTRQRGTATLLAALWPGDALILMTALKATPEEAFGAPHVIALPVSREQSLAIQRYVWESLTVPAVPVADGPYAGSIFYAAEARYSAVNTCNTWAAHALQAGGVQIRSTGVVLAGQLWTQVRRLAPDLPEG
jgi:hypothetical protein